MAFTLNVVKKKYNNYCNIIIYYHTTVTRNIIVMCVLYTLSHEVIICGVFNLVFK